MQSNFFVILGNQLFEPDYLVQKGCQEVFMAEDQGLCTTFKYHKSKIYLFLTAMREYNDLLIKKSIKTDYHKLDERNDSDDYVSFLLKFLISKNIKQINIFEIEDKSFEKIFIETLSKADIEIEIHQTPMFIFGRDNFKAMAKGKKVYRMASFYQKARKELGLLMDEENKPIGGKWSYDEENRKKIPKNTVIPELSQPEISTHHDSIVQLITTKFNDHPGGLEEIWFPVTRQGAIKQLDEFLKIRFENFGRYEDAMQQDQNFLFHSCISPFLNIGLITPKEVIDKAVLYSDKNSIPLNSLEGFIRQIIGWREFVRGIYQEEGLNQLKSNYWGNKKKLSSSWYDGTTGIAPLDDCIKTTLKDGYIHHIPRLMVISNIMNLCGVDPKEIYKWFMEMYIDSSEWVMVPNVFGMATYADGGLMSTKPYTCGSNYILKMSNYKRGEWCDTLDGLYWSFTEKNRKFYQSNPRLSLLTRSLDKLDPDRKKHIFSEAKKFIKNNTI
jgi:deoxyribodipyrimidine photolyase-related protein